MGQLNTKDQLQPYQVLALRNTPHGKPSQEILDAKQGIFFQAQTTTSIRFITELVFAKKHEEQTMDYATWPHQQTDLHLDV